MQLNAGTLFTHQSIFERFLDGLGFYCLVATTDKIILAANKNIWILRMILLLVVDRIDPRVQGWCSGESTRLPPMWPGFDSQTRRHMWVEFVGSLLSTERFSPGTPVSPLLKNRPLT